MDFSSWSLSGKVDGVRKEEMQFPWPLQIFYEFKTTVEKCWKEATASMKKAEKETPKKCKNHPFSLNVNTSLALVKH